MAEAHECEPKLAAAERASDLPVTSRALLGRLTLVEAKGGPGITLTATDLSDLGRRPCQGQAESKGYQVSRHSSSGAQEETAHGTTDEGRDNTTLRRDGAVLCSRANWRQDE